MRDFFTSTRFKILACLFSVLLGLMAYAAVRGGAASLPKQILFTVSSPFVRAAGGITAFMNNSIGTIINADKYKTENGKLRKELSELQKKVIEFDEIQAENAEYKKMMKIAEHHEDFEWSPPCTVIARDANDIFGSFTINRGSLDGIGVGDPVITEIGLVGKVSEVGDNFAKVTTILSPDVRMGVIAAEKSIIGLVENTADVSARGECYMSFVGVDSGLAVGDVVVTTSGVVFPNGIIVGKVSEIVADPGGLSLHAVIRPSEHIFEVSSVFVITKWNGQHPE